MDRVNASYTSDDPRGRAISNFSEHSFVLDGICCGTVEAFIQGIKFPSDDPRREQIFAMKKGFSAWKMRVHAAGEYVWWNGQAISYRSPEHLSLIERAIEAKFNQNPDALGALKSTQGLAIIHESGIPESPLTSLPAEAYCQMLTRIRDQ